MQRNNILIWAKANLSSTTLNMSDSLTRPMTFRSTFLAQKLQCTFLFIISHLSVRIHLVCLLLLLMMVNENVSSWSVPNQAKSFLFSWLPSWVTDGVLSRLVPFCLFGDVGILSNVATTFEHSVHHVHPLFFDESTTMSYCFTLVNHSHRS